MFLAKGPAIRIRHLLSASASSDPVLGDWRMIFGNTTVVAISGSDGTYMVAATEPRPGNGLDVRAVRGYGGRVRPTASQDLDALEA